MMLKCDTIAACASEIEGIGFGNASRSGILDERKR